jgi:hypothetical protein
MGGWCTWEIGVIKLTVEGVGFSTRLGADLYKNIAVRTKIWEDNTKQ